MGQSLAGFREAIKQDKIFYFFFIVLLVSISLLPTSISVAMWLVLDNSAAYAGAFIWKVVCLTSVPTFLYLFYFIIVLRNFKRRNICGSVLLLSIWESLFVYLVVIRGSGSDNPGVLLVPFYIVVPILILNLLSFLENYRDKSGVRIAVLLLLIVVVSIPTSIWAISSSNKNKWIEFQKFAAIATSTQNLTFEERLGYCQKIQGKPFSKEIYLNSQCNYTVNSDEAAKRKDPDLCFLFSGQDFEKCLKPTLASSSLESIISACNRRPPLFLNAESECILVGVESNKLDIADCSLFEPSNDVSPDGKKYSESGYTYVLNRCYAYLAETKDKKWCEKITSDRTTRQRCLKTDVYNFS